MHLGRWAPLALVVSAQLEASGAEPAAGATGGRVRLELLRGPGAEGCPSPPILEAGIRERLGYDPFQADAKRSVHASVERVGDSLHAKVELWDGEILAGEQQLISPTADCADLVPVLELVISLAVDRTESKEPAGPTAPPEVEVRVSVVPKTQAPATAEASTRAAGGPYLAAEVGVLAAVGAAPALSFGFTLGLEAYWTHFSFGLEGRADLPASKPVPSGGSIRTALILGTLVPCYRKGLLAGCGLLALGAEQGAGVGYEGALKGSKFYGAAGARFQADPLSAGAFSLRLHLDLLVPFERTDAQVLNPTSGVLETVWTTPPLSGALGVEAVFRIP